LFDNEDAVALLQRSFNTKLGEPRKSTKERNYNSRRKINTIKETLKRCQRLVSLPRSKRGGNYMLSCHQKECKD
jgi:hypothetical protein